jgi:hypothetical protein
MGRRPWQAAANDRALATGTALKIWAEQQTLERRDVATGIAGCITVGKN